MKKFTNIFLFIVLFSFLFLTAPVFYGIPAGEGSPDHPAPVLKNDTALFKTIKHDTIIKFEHPNYQDSLMVVTIVNGVMKMITIAAPGAKNFREAYGFLSGPIVAVILWAWRRRSIRKLRKMGVLSGRDNWERLL